ncbi:hypothetical protein SAMN05720354_10727 [Nitrosospira sp. Nsp1]|nr:hypothetical protein SAMN05720354_10727 [Nitrosospira sp. Nsp1]
MSFVVPQRITPDALLTVGLFMCLRQSHRSQVAMQVALNQTDFLVFPQQINQSPSPPFISPFQQRIHGGLGTSRPGMID